MLRPKFFRLWADKAKRATSSNWLRKHGFRAINSETATSSTGDLASTKPAGVAGVFFQSGTREAWWPLDKDLHLASTQPALEPVAGTYISFSPQDDYSVHMDKAQRVLVRDLISDIGEPVFTQRYQPATSSAKNVDASDQEQPSLTVKRLQSPWLYATTQARLNSIPSDVQLISGLATIRGLLATSPSVHALQAPFVTGVLFQGDGVQAMVLMVCSESAELSQMDYIPLAGLDPASAVRSFVQSVRLSASGEWSQDRTAIFTGDELLRLQPALREYPREAQILGVPASKIWGWAAKSSTVALGFSAATLAALTYLNHSNATEVQQSQLQRVELQKAIKGMVASDRLAAVLERRSVRIDDAITKASAVWQEGSLVSLAATADAIKLTVTHKVQATELSPEQNPQALAKALSISVPEGCARAPVSITPQISELYLTYECQTSDRDLQRLLTAAR